MSGVHADHEVQRRTEYEQIFRVHRRAVDRFVAATYPTVDRDEIVALTFEVAWRRLDDAPADAVRGWLLGIARNHARNAIRGRGRRRTVVDALAATPTRRVSWLHDEHLSAETARRLATALDQLQDGDREVIELAAFGDLRGAELGVALGITAGAASVRLHRARQRLVDIYGADQ